MAWSKIRGSPEPAQQRGQDCNARSSREKGEKWGRVREWNCSGGITKPLDWFKPCLIALLLATVIIHNTPRHEQVAKMRYSVLGKRWHWINKVTIRGLFFKFRDIAAQPTQVFTCREMQESR